MKWQALAAVVLTGVTLMGGCTGTPVQTVAVPRADDPSAYRPQIEPKPLPPDGYMYGQPAGQPMPQGGQQTLGNPSIENEDAFVAAYQKRSPRIMVFVNRTIEGEPLSKDNLDDVIRGQNIPSAIGATSVDYDMMEASLVQFFDNSGKVRVVDSAAARQKLNREQLLRIENADPAANQLLATELKQDVLIQVIAAPTRQAASGQPAVRLIAKAVSTTDARTLGTAMVDMPLPMSKTNITIYTRYLAGDLMGQMAKKWSQPAQFDPIEVRIYKTASVDDSLAIRKWMTNAPGVSNVQTTGATGGAGASYATFLVGFGGAPEDFYAELKDGIGQSTGLKAVDLTGNTISLEVTGPMNLVTTTRHVDTTTTVETRTTEERHQEPVTPAATQQ